MPMHVHQIQNVHSGMVRSRSRLSGAFVRIVMSLQFAQIDGDHLDGSSLDTPERVETVGGNGDVHEEGCDDSPGLDLCGYGTEALVGAGVDEALVGCRGGGGGGEGAPRGWLRPNAGGGTGGGGSATARPFGRWRFADPRFAAVAPLLIAVLLLLLVLGRIAIEQRPHLLLPLPLPFIFLLLLRIHLAVVVILGGRRFLVEQILAIGRHSSCASASVALVRGHPETTREVKDAERAVGEARDDVSSGGYHREGGAFLVDGKFHLPPLDRFDRALRQGR
mmetsp:Transcript_12268/g.35988  ORF Transcript_12268/g.35988 Transcript_12268/m.35988 type:complete len:278 (-) Transcript_12268:270-1103(-)